MCKDQETRRRNEAEVSQLNSMTDNLRASLLFLIICLKHEGSGGKVNEVVSLNMAGIVLQYAIQNRKQIYCILGFFLLSIFQCVKMTPYSSLL